MDLAHCTTLLFDLTLGERVQILGERRGGMYKSGICDTKPSISVKRSSLEPKLLPSVYRNSCAAYRLVTNLVTRGELWPTFSGSRIFPQRISRTLFCRSAIIWQCLANRNLFPEFRELWSVGPVIPCGDMHQPFSDAVVKCFCRQLSYVCR